MPMKLSLSGAMQIRIRAEGPSGNPVSCWIIHSHVYPFQDTGLNECARMGDRLPVVFDAG